MKQRYILLLLVFLLLIPSLAGAADDGESKRLSDLTTFAILEGISAGLSYFAAEHPNEIGLINVCIPPFLIFGGDRPPDQRKKSNWDWRMAPFYAMFIATGIYNLNVDEDDYSKSEVFKTNFSILSAGALATVLLKPYAKESDNSASSSFPDLGLHIGPRKVAASVIFHF